MMAMVIPDGGHCGQLPDSFRVNVQTTAANRACRDIDLMVYPSNLSAPLQHAQSCGHTIGVGVRSANAWA